MINFGSPRVSLNYQQPNAICPFKMNPISRGILGCVTHHTHNIHIHLFCTFKTHYARRECRVIVWHKYISIYIFVPVALDEPFLGYGYTKSGFVLYVPASWTTRARGWWPFFCILECCVSCKHPLSTTRTTMRGCAARYVARPGMYVTHYLYISTNTQKSAARSMREQQQKK